MQVTSAITDFSSFSYAYLSLYLNIHPANFNLLSCFRNVRIRNPAVTFVKLRLFRIGVQGNSIPPDWYPSELTKSKAFQIGTLKSKQNWDPSDLAKLGPIRVGKNRTLPDWRNENPSGLAKLGPFWIGKIGILRSWQNWDPSELAKLGPFRLSKIRSLPN